MGDRVNRPGRAGTAIAAVVAARLAVAGGVLPGVRGAGLRAGAELEAGDAMSWALRHAFFAENRSPALRHELLDITREIATQAALDVKRFEYDWDSGRYKATIIAESRRGWHELVVGGSPTFVLPDGRQVSSPAGGEADIDEEHGVVRHYVPFVGDPLAVFRELLDSAAQGTE